MVVTFFGVKNWQTRAAVWVHYHATRKVSQKQNAAEQTCWMRFHRRSIPPL